MVASSKYGENIHLSTVGYLWCLGGNKYMEKYSFSKVFASLGMPPLIPKMNIFRFLDGNSMFYKGSIVAKSRGGFFCGWW